MMKKLLMSALTLAAFSQAHASGVPVVTLHELDAVAQTDIPLEAGSVGVLYHQNTGCRFEVVVSVEGDTHMAYLEQAICSAMVTSVDDKKFVLEKPVRAGETVTVPFGFTDIMKMTIDEVISAPHAAPDTAPGI